MYIILIVFKQLQIDLYLNISFGSKTKQNSVFTSNLFGFLVIF